MFTLAGNITLDSLTHYVHKLSGIRFSFNSSKVKGAKAIHFPASRYKLDDLLAQVKRTTSLYYSFFNGYVVFQDNPPPLKPGVTHVAPQRRVVQAKPLVKKGASAKQLLVNNKTTVSQKEVDSTISGSLVSIIKTSAEEIKNVAPTMQLADSTALPLLQNPQDLSDTIEHYRFSLVLKNDSERHSFSLGLIDTTEKQKSPKNDKTKSRASLRHFGGSTTYSSNNNQNRRGLDLDYGLQWKLPVPVQGTKYFFTGADGKSQPYVFLVPGVFIGKTINDIHKIRLELQALQHFYSTEQSLSETFEQVSPSDTATIHSRINVVKTYGYTIGLHYQRLYNDKWFIGCGVSYHVQSKALLHYQKNVVATGISLQDSLAALKRGDANWSRINNAFISIDPEIGLQFRKTQIGLQSSLPVITSVYKNMNIYPIAIRLFFRWQWNERH